MNTEKSFSFIQNQLMSVGLTYDKAKKLEDLINSREIIICSMDLDKRITSKIQELINLKNEGEI